METENYTGTVIEESLSDRSILDRVRIVSTVIEPVTGDHKTPWIKQWTMHGVEISESDAAEFAQKLSKSLDRKHSWYADFKRDSEHYIVFVDKVFHITDRTNKAQYDAAIQYGCSLGIPEYQLDFSPHIKTRER